MAETVTFREIKGSDAEKLIQLVVTVRAETNNAIINIDTEYDAIDLIKNIIANPDRLFLVAVIDEEIIGMLTLTPVSERFGFTELELGIAVVQKYWGLGIASELLAMGIDWAKQIFKKPIIKLDVYAKNIAAIKLYEKFGFQRYKIKSVAHTIRNKLIPTLVFEKNLS